MGWISVVLVLDSGGSLAQQHVLGGLTWLLLLAVLAAQSPLVRAQVGIVVAFATAVEYTFSPLLGVYVYRFDNVPAYVPPGHGLVYLAALALGQAAFVQRRLRGCTGCVLLVGAAYALHGVTLASRPDVLGAFWFLCLAGFLLWGPSPGLYVGAFVVVTYLELMGTSLGTWAWRPSDPTGLIPIGNPPSGAAGGYGWFDLAAVLAAPVLLERLHRWRSQSPSSVSRRWRWVLSRDTRPGSLPAEPGSGVRSPRKASASSWRRPLLDTAPAPRGPGRPARSVNLPPASSTTIESAAMSCSLSSGSAAMSTAPSATSRWDQKSP
jgi:hypothetical protein